ncbi:MAG: cation transporter [Planctomycetota bacterium]|nr:cation transporter [Planctomycetota bacterium]
MKWMLRGVLVNAILAIVKILAGMFGNSYALVADGVESTLDILGSLLVWGGLHISSAPPDAGHPYGHGKAEPLAAIVVSLTLVGAGVLLAIESVREILTPHHAPAPFTLFVLVGVVVVKETLFRTIFEVGEAIGSTAVIGDAWHHRSDALTSACAFVGIGIALVMGKGYESADDWATLAACAVIAYNGYRIFRPALAEMMDAAPNPDVEARIRETAGAVAGVQGLDKCLVRKSGLAYFVDLHVLVDGAMTVEEGHALGHQVKDALMKAGLSIADVLVHLEPATPERLARAEATQALARERVS